MPHGLSTLSAAVRGIRPTQDDRPDEELLREFVAHRDEVAFAALVRRHHQIVWRVCVRILRHRSDAEDAFQATFLVLARSGRLLADRGGIGGWLYRVADRVARSARVMAIRRQRREERMAKTAACADHSPADPDLLTILTEELDRLPEHHRLAVLACDLDGLGRTEAATRLGWNEGTLSARLHRGRKALAERLKARGITGPLVAIGALAAGPAATAGLVPATSRLAMMVTTSGLTNRAVPASVAALVTHITREMAMRILTKTLVTATLLAVFLAGGWHWLSDGSAGQATAAPVPAAKGDVKPDVPPTALQLLRNRKVHRELKCTADQRVTIADHFDDQFDAAANRGPLLLIVPGQPRNPQADKQEIEARVKEIQDVEAADTKAMADKVLTANQLTRLAQIELQVRGAEALIDPKVAVALKLTDDQKQVVEGAITEVESNGGGGFDTGPARAAGLPRYWHLDAKQRKAAYDAAAKCLTKEQAAEWKKLTGEPVATFDPHTIGGRGGSVTSGIQFRGN